MLPLSFAVEVEGFFYLLFCCCLVDAYVTDVGEESEVYWLMRMSPMSARRVKFIVPAVFFLSWRMRASSSG